MPTLRRRSPRRRHYLADENEVDAELVDQPVASPKVDPWAQPFPADSGVPQAYKVTNPLPVVVPASGGGGSEVYDVPPLEPAAPTIDLGGVLGYATPALAAYTLLADEAPTFMRLTAAYVLYQCLAGPNGLLANTKLGFEVPMSGYRPGGCGCRG